MKRNYLTIILIVIVVVLSGFRFHHRAIRPPQYGIPITLVHNCSNEEALRELGDDRQIIVESNAEGSISINGMHFTSSTIGSELAKIFQSRSLKLVWFIADPQLTYGQAVKNLSDLQANNSNFIVAIPTTSQIAAASLPVPTGQIAAPNSPLTRPESQCPYGL
jgi:biopolymer transport protein ExbD